TSVYYANFFTSSNGDIFELRHFPTRRSSDLVLIQLARVGEEQRDHGRVVPVGRLGEVLGEGRLVALACAPIRRLEPVPLHDHQRSEEHTSELQSREKLVCRLLLEKKKI